MRKLFLGLVVVISLLVACATPTVTLVPSTVPPVPAPPTVEPITQPTTAPNPLLTTPWEKFPVAVTVATHRMIGGEDTEIWYGQKLEWPEKPYDRGGHGFILSPAVKPELIGRTIRGSFEVPFEDLIMIFSPHEENDGLAKDVAFRSQKGESVLQAYFCEMRVYSGGLGVIAHYNVYYAPKSTCSEETIVWGNVKRTLLHAPAAVLGYGPKYSRTGELWINGSVAGANGPWGNILY
ncbi:MAG: hypothetical protein AAB486_04350 [Patescibacteria group bacterium]